MRYNRFRTVLALATLALSAGHAPAQCDGNLFKLLPSDQASPLEFGESVGISGATMIVGSSWTDGIAPGTGAAYLFDTTTGLQTAKLFASDGVAQHGFGAAVAIDGPFAVVGAKDDAAGGSNSGAAYVFDVATGSQVFKLIPNDGQAGDEFGQSVAIHGSSILVGAWMVDKAYLFDATTGAQLSTFQSGTGLSEAFGYALALDSTTAIIGAPTASNVFSSDGLAYLFSTVSGNQLGTLAPSIPEEWTFFGASVDIHGTTAIVGQLSQGFGEANLFDVPSLTETFVLKPLTPSWEDNFGVAVALADGRALVGNSSWNWNDTFNDIPTAHLFDTATGLQIHEYLGPDAVFGSGFGHVVAMHGNKAIVGSPGTVMWANPGGSAALIDTSMALEAVPFCDVNRNVTGQHAIIQACGSASISANDFRLSVYTIPNKPYLFFHGANPSSTPLGHGFLCASGDIQRLGPAQLATTESGTLVVDLPTEIATAGTRHFQCWYRDALGWGAPYNLSNALSVTFVP